MSEAVGVGVVGFWHVHALDYVHDVAACPKLVLVGGWDHSPIRSGASAGDLDLPFYGSLDDLLADDRVGAVTVTTETARHVETVRAAISAGKHVFCEKVLALDPQDCAALIAEAGDRGVSLIVSLPRLFEPSVRRAQELIAAGTLGDVTYCRVSMVHDGWVTGWLPESFADYASSQGGALIDLGVHPLLISHELLSGTVRRVNAHLASVTGRRVEDNVVVTIEYESGAIAVVETSFVAATGELSFEVRGTKGALTYSDAHGLSARGGSWGTSWIPIELPPVEYTPMSIWVDEINGYRGPEGQKIRAAAVELSRFIQRAYDEKRAAFEAMNGPLREGGT